MSHPMNQRVNLFLLVLCGVMVAGCGSYSNIRLERRGAIGGAVPSVPSSAKVAVLKVTAREAEQQLSSGWAVGVAEYPAAARDFADLVAHAADRAQWAQVMSPIEVEDATEGQEMEFDLQPDRAQLDKVAKALDCSHYLTADVRKWRMSYLVFFQRSCVVYTLSCYETGKAEPLWQAQGDACERYATDREVAIRALERTFRRVKDRATAKQTQGAS